MSEYTRALMEISADALQHNLAVLHQYTMPARVLAVLKANAYGHGLVTVAQILQNKVDGFGVACLSEAIQLRQAGITNKIVVLEGAFSAEEYAIASQCGLDMVIHHEVQCRWLLQYPTIEPIVIWVKLNTGMNRLGILPDLADILLKKLRSTPIVQSIILMSHLASADQLTSPLTTKQLNVFKQLIQRYPTLPYSLANSAAIFVLPESHYHWVRPGLALYGVSPFQHHTEIHPTLSPVMTLKTKIIAIQQVQPGEVIGYYGRVFCQTTKRIGIIAFGYGDGYPYDAPEGTPVLIGKQPVPLIGQVSMDMVSIDLTTRPEVRLGEEVILWGKGLPIEKIAHHTHRSCYELLCGIQRPAQSRIQMQVI